LGTELNRKWSAFRQRWLGDDLFDRTRNKLTLQYSGVLILFLSLFVIIVYTVLYVLIWNDQQHRLQKQVNSELRSLQKWANQDNTKRPPPPDLVNLFTISADQSFYYLVDNRGTIVMGDELQPMLRDQISELIAAGQLEERGIQQRTLHILDRPSDQDQSQPGKGKEARFIVTSRILQAHGEPVGTLYVGKEVTFQYDLFRWLLLILIGMALLFFVLALLFSHLMSRKAIIPIAQAYKRQREFVADASHELRTPLSVMLSSIEALQLEDNIDNDPFSVKILNGMKNEVHRMTKLAGELLNLARSDSGQLHTTREGFDLKTAADSIIEKLQPLAHAKRIILKLRSPAEIQAYGDSEQLKQLLVLLVDNAIKYTPDEGSVDILLSSTTEKNKHFIVLEVTDTGIGIPAEALPRIFERFYRQDKSRTRQIGGHGLGLAIAKSIVDAHQGTIQVSSVPGAGSTFRIRIPLTQ
jgi:signal transduction histidine kinase